MEFEYSKVTDDQNKRAVEIGLQLNALANKKKSVYAQKAADASVYDSQITEIQVEEVKLTEELNNISIVTVTSK